MHLVPILERLRQPITMYVCMYVCVYVCMYVCTYVRTYVRLYVCMYVCMYVCIIHNYILHVQVSHLYMYMYMFSPGLASNCVQDSRHSIRPNLPYPNRWTTFSTPYRRYRSLV